VSQSDENAEMHHSIHPTKNSQDKGNETSDSDNSKDWTSDGYYRS
jgi:hypothetical protein